MEQSFRFVLVLTSRDHFLIDGDFEGFSLKAKFCHFPFRGDGLLLRWTIHSNDLAWVLGNDCSYPYEGTAANVFGLWWVNNTVVHYLVGDHSVPYEGIVVNMFLLVFQYTIPG